MSYLEQTEYRKLPFSQSSLEGTFLHPRLHIVRKSIPYLRLQLRNNNEIAALVLVLPSMNGMAETMSV